MKDQLDTSKTTKISIHSLKNILGHENQISLFSDHDKKFASEFGINIIDSIRKFGVNLTDTQLKVLEGLLIGFSQTGYKGNITSQKKSDISREKFSGKLPDTYKYIEEIPRLKATQSQILEWAGINKSSIASKMRALEALRELGTIQFCFYYDRLSFSDNGIPNREANGKWKKEQVISVDTLFTIKEIEQKESEIISYYEITPSSIFIDQIDGFFILIPYKWRDEVRQITGNKKISSYIFLFLIFLRYQYELKRRFFSNNDLLQLKWSPEEIAIAIKMPESIYKRKKKRMNKVLDDAYSIAKQLGYLSSYERNGYVDILYFNDSKYSLIQHSCKEIEENKKESEKLLENFIKLKKSIDCNFSITSNEKSIYIKELDILLSKRPAQDIENIMKWSITQKYWSSQLANPCKLRKNFSDAWIEYKIAQKSSKEEMHIQNKRLALEKLKELHEKCASKTVYKEGEASLFLGDVGVELTCGASYSIVEYKDTNFLDKLRENLKKHRFSESGII